MFKNNLKIAFRSLRKNKVYSIITLVGLTVGIAAALLIFRMVNYELSFNKNFENYDRIVRVVYMEENADDGDHWGTCTPLPAMDAMQETVSQFAEMSRMHEFWATLSVPNPDGGAPLKKFNMEEGETAFFTEPSFFQIFDVEWLAGESETALIEPNVIVLTEEYALKFFDDAESAMGKEMLIDNVVPVVVKGVIADFPTNCDFPIPFLSSWETFKSHPEEFFYSEQWGSCSSNNQVYALMHDPAQTEVANEILAKVGAEEYTGHTGFQEKKHVTQPLSDLHHNEDLSHSGTHRVAHSRLRILGGIGVLILIMACFNFINLTTAQSSLRAKEVGVRKTLGSGRKELFSQFMSETGLIVFGAVILGVNLATICAPLLKHVSDVPDELPFLANPMVWGFLGIVSVGVTLLAGIYPSLALASFKPVEALRSKASQTKWAGAPLRKSLVVLQFVIAQALIIGAIVALNQLDYIRSRDLGFSQKLVYNFGVNVDESALSRQSALKQELLDIPTVETVSFSSDQPFSGNTWAQNFRWASRPEDENFSITMKFADPEFQTTYGLDMVAGKWYDASDTIRQCVVNETLLRKLGNVDPNEAVGLDLLLGGSQPVQVTGVVKDFHTHSLHQEQRPLMITTLKNYYWNVSVKIRPDDIAGTVAAMQKSFDKVMPEQVFDGTWFDERIAAFYEDENRLASTCKGFGFLAILISCLGLFGLAAHAAQQRVKEIGVRKVLGATTANIVGLLSKDFLRLVLLALVVATPIAYYFMENWLQDFAYRIDIKWWVFALAGILVTAIAFMTVSFQSIKAALVHPVKSLRSE